MFKFKKAKTPCTDEMMVVCVAPNAAFDEIMIPVSRGVSPTTFMKTKMIEEDRRNA